MKFSNWIKIKEQSAMGDSASATTSFTSGGTVSSDIKSVSKPLVSKQTSDCGDCSKDWRNWFYTKKNRKK